MKKYIVFIVMFFALFIRIWGIKHNLPYLYQTEEYKTVNYALKFGSGDLNPHFFEYPSLYLYFMFFVYGIYFIIGKLFGIFSNVSEFAFSFIRDPSNIYIIGRVLSALWGTGVVYLTYLIGNKLYNFRVGIVAALSISFIPSIVISSHFIKPDMAMIFFSLLGFLFVIKILQTDDYKYYYLAGISFGIGASLKYMPVLMSILIPLAHIIKKRNLFDIKLLLSLFLVPIFFVIGTPYALLDFNNFIRDIKNLFIPSAGGGSNLLGGLINTLNCFITINSNTDNVVFLGIFFLVGVLFVFFKLEKKDILVLTTMMIYFLLIIRHTFPAKGYLFLSFPFFLILGAKFVDYLSVKINKFIVYIIFFLCLYPSIYECTAIDYSFTQKDSRTIAKEWIEKKIAFYTKILIDRYPNSPPIMMTKEQIYNLYKTSKELESYKEQYLKLQYESHPGKIGYEVYEISRPANEIGSTIRLAEEAQKVRALFDISNGFKNIKKSGFKYIIFSDWDKKNAYVVKNTVRINFYNQLSIYAKLLKKIEPLQKKWYPGPTIYIYKLY